MKKILTLIIFCSLFSASLFAQYFESIAELDGFKISSEKVQELNLASKKLHEVYDSLGEEFKVLNFSYYSLSTYMEVDSEPLWSEIQTKASERSKFYFLVAKQYNRSGLYDIKVKVNIPRFDGCFSDQNILELENQIRQKIIGNNDHSLGLLLALRDITPKIIQRLICCEVGNRDCTLTFEDDTSILDELIEYGYYAYPVKLLPPGIVNEIKNNRLNCGVSNNNTTPFEINGTTYLNIEGKLCDYSTGYNSKFYISDNKSYRTTFQSVKFDLIPGHYELAGHFHIYESSDPDKIPDMILWQDYSESLHSWYSSGSNQGLVLTPFKFAETLPILPEDVIPGKPKMPSILQDG